MSKLDTGKVKKVAWEMLFVFFIAIIFFMVLFPIVWIFLTSIKFSVDAMAIPPKWIFTPTSSHYIEVMTERRFLNYFSNSLIVSVSSLGLVLLIGIPTAYVLTRYNFRGKKHVAFWILTTRMAPPITFLIPFFILYRNLGLLDSKLGLIILHITINLALVIWMLKGFFQEIPREMEEAALVDGCSPTQAFMRISLPLAAPGIAATAILGFVFSWNELMFALVLTSTRAKTIPVGLYTFLGYHQVKWGSLCAGTMLAVFPVFMFIMFVQKHLIRGLTFGALK